MSLTHIHYIHIFNKVNLQYNCHYSFNSVNDLCANELLTSLLLKCSHWLLPLAFILSSKAFYYEEMKQISAFTRLEDHC